MALLRMDLFSQCLMRTVPITAVVPVDNVRYAGEPERPVDMPYKMLILLHGIYGCCMDWINISDVMMMAQERNLVVIMPEGENGFYVDHPQSGIAYGKFIGEELVKRMRQMFHISEKREDTFICGLSMGGYGALRNGLKYGDTFGYAAGLSTGFIEKQMEESTYEFGNDYTQGRGYYESIFGDLSKFEGSENDCKALYQKRKNENLSLPKLYMAVGTEDFLLEPNRSMRDFLLEQDADLVYEEGPGGHEPMFWRTYLEHVFNWLPLEDKAAGISSGNVKR